MPRPLLSGLRPRLTALYLLVGLLLVGVVGGSAYGLLRYYFESTTDLALRYAMAQQLQLLGAPIPSELNAASAAWTGRTPTTSRDREKDHESDDKLGVASDSELAAIYVLALDSSGRLAPGPGAAAAPDPTAAAAALARGSDLRTIHRSDGTAVRLLTYRVDRIGAPALLQLGRPLVDQERILRDMVTGLVGVGAGCVVVLTVLSWWVAGRSLRPARAAWDRQQAFVAGAGHELRAPLTLIRATADVALRELPPELSDQRQLWTDVMRDSDQMARLVEDLLLLARLDAGRLSLNTEAVSVGEMLYDLERQVGRLAAQRGIRLVVDEADGEVQADPDRLRQTLLILLDNALRHTANGGEIRLSGEVAERTVRLVVRDTGEGIAPEHLGRVFERFYVVDDSRRFEGSGLGLAIAKSLVEAQRGTIRLSSRVGEGTRVEITLPRT